MFGCVGARDKGGPQSSVRPSCPRGVECSPNSITVEFILSLHGEEAVVISQVACCFQFLDIGSFSSSWAPISDIDWRVVSATVASAGDAKTNGNGCHSAAGFADSDGAVLEKNVSLLCSATLPGLDPEKDYTLKVLSRGNPKEQFFASGSFLYRTADRPKPHDVQLEWNGRRANSVEISWLLPDPRGAAVQECEVQYRTDAVLTSWVPFEGPLHVCPFPSDDGAPRLWRGSITGLRGATHYRLRARARNAVGWSHDFSRELCCQTSEFPLPPRDLILCGRRPTSVTMYFAIDDPEGAPVEACTVQVHGLLGYSEHKHCRFEFLPPSVDKSGYHLKGSRRGVCVLEGLQPEAEVWVRMWSQSAVGLSRVCSPAMLVATSERPKAPSSLFVQVGPRSVEVEWDLVDPEGAPVETCELEYSRDSVFAFWEIAKAEPVAIIMNGVANYDVSAMAARMATVDATASCSTVRRWRVQVDGLDRETAYLLRARSCNSVGWSASYSQTLVARTTDRPPPPQNFRCTARLPTAVQLELSVAEVLGTAPVTSLQVEQSGSFAWQELTEVEITKIPTEDLRDRKERGVSHWKVIATLGRHPGVVHKLRVWASNTFGRCSEPSNSCVCRTSDRPDPPTAFKCIERLPHALVLQWAVPDPEGAPVLRFEVQCRKDLAFASWQPAACADTVRAAHPNGATPQSASRKGAKWRCVIEQLDPSSLYQVSVRAYNEAGWSEWRSEEEAGFETSRAPRATPTQLEVRHVIAAADGKQGGGWLLVEMALPDPDGAPVVACMVKYQEDGPWALARRRGYDSPGSWLARFPGVKLGDGTTPVSIRAANAVGWSEEYRVAQPVMLQQESHDARVHIGPDSAGDGSAVALVVREVRAALKEQEAAKERVKELCGEAAARGDQDHTALLARHGVEVEKRMEVLKEVCQQLDPEGGTIAEEQGAQLVSQFDKELKKQKLLPDAASAAKVLSLLLRAYIWLETTWRAELRTLSSGIEQAMQSVPSSGGRVLHQWAKQHQAWSEAFDEKVSGALPDGVGTATQLLATLVSGRKLELFKTVKSDLAACFTLVSAAERQLKRLRYSYRILLAAEASTCQNFQGKNTLQKIETTALGVLTMLVLPVPGSIETGAVGIGMLWLEGDGGAGSHLALEHPNGAQVAPMLERLGSSPPPRAAVILAGWANGGHKGVVLVHNATARRITVTVMPDKLSIGSKAFDKFSDAHPMVRAVGSAMSQGDGGDHLSTILPTDVALIQIPKDMIAETVPGQTPPVKLEFAYGPASHAERPMGRATVCQGTAVTFMHLDASLQVSNIDSDNSSVDLDGTVTVVNNDLAPVKVNVFRAPEAQKHFESALMSETFQSGETRLMPLPQPCTGRIFQIEVVYEDSKKAICEVRPGQRLIIESAA